MSSRLHHACIERFAAAARADERIAAAFVGGSRGAGTADDHADTDLYLVLRDAAYDDFFAERRAFMARLGAPVFLEDFGDFGFDMLLFIFADGVEGELVLARASAFAHIPNGPFRALVDRDGILPDGAFPALAELGADEQRDAVRWLIAWFWRDVSQLCRYMARGRLWSAYAHLEMARHTCLGLVRAQQSGRPARESYHGIEAEVAAPELAPFQATYCPVEHDALLGALHSLIAIYQRVAPPLAATYSLAYPAQLADTVLRRLAEVSAAPELRSGTPAALAGAAHGR